MTAPQVYPYLRYEDATEACAWLQLAFGFDPLFVVSDDDGKVHHAELRLGDGVILLGPADPEAGESSPRGLEAVPGGIYCFIQELEPHFERAAAAGAQIVRPIYGTDYGSQEYSALDLEGHHWSFGTFRPEDQASD